MLPRVDAYVAEAGQVILVEEEGEEVNRSMDMFRSLLAESIMGKPGTPRRGAPGAMTGAAPFPAVPAQFPRSSG